MQETAQTATFEQVRKTLSTKETSFKKKKQKKSLSKSNTESTKKKNKFLDLIFFLF